jgi:hypothetical protein
MLTLPDGTRRSESEVLDAVHDYNRAVFDLFDMPFSGPHDKLRPIDLLALNALNAWGRGQPMTAMTAAWECRADIAAAVAPVSREPLEKLSKKEVGEQSRRVGAALDRIDRISGFGSTASAKLFHRLRPNLGPIWDQRVGQWYDPKMDWEPWVALVYSHVLEPGTRKCLIAARKHLGVPLTLLRVWDVLLWQLRGQVR